MSRLVCLLLALNLLSFAAGQYGYNPYGSDNYDDDRIQNCELQRHRGKNHRKCTPACTRQSDCYQYGSNVKCLCDGDCGSSCINPEEQCFPKDLRLQHGTVEVTPRNKFEAMANYKCHQGYEMIGLPARVCQGDKTWSGEPPYCKLLSKYLVDDDYCDPPDPVPHAFYKGGTPGQRRFENGALLVFECDPGYKFSQESLPVYKAWCRGKEGWLGPRIRCVRKAPGCDEPEPILNGNLVKTGGNQVGAVVKYYCNEGYFITKDEDRVCQENGTWSGKAPKCGEVLCGPPPALENGDGNHDSKQVHFEAGHRVTYRCRIGFYRTSEGGDRAVCDGRNGSWVGPKMTCQARDCQDPGEIPNGRRTSGYRFPYGSKVTYTCNEGYSMIPGQVDHIMCKADGQWMNNKPTCYPVNCSGLSPPTHGTMIGTGTKFRSTVRFICNTGFKVIGSQERTCMSDGRWSGQDVTCAEIDCGAPNPIYNGVMSGHGTTVGSTVTFSCNQRYKVEPLVRTSVCMSDGQWSVQTPDCLGQCRTPSIQDGTYRLGYVDSWVSHNATVKPQCHNGLVLNDSRTMRCHNGTWTIIPRCEPAPCNSPPPLLKNGHRVFFKLSHNARARYFCMAGYKLVGDKYMRCLLGKWTGKKPTCIEDYCNKPGKLKNGTIYKKGTKSSGKYIFRPYITTIRHGDRLIYECHRNFKLVGPKGAACVQGKWSPERKPECVPAKHPLFRKIFYPHQEMSPARMY